MPRRLCFDIASSWFYGLYGWLKSPNDARRHFRDSSFNFWAATVFDESSKRYLDFVDINDLFSCLSKADEIITFNGRNCDLVVIEKLVGEEAAKILWAKTHHDLAGWRGRNSLNQAMCDFVPDLYQRSDSVKAARQRELESYCSMSGPLLDTDRMHDLVGTYRDTLFTYELFKRYLESGDSDRTFNDSSLLVPMNSL